MVQYLCRAVELLNGLHFECSASFKESLSILYRASDKIRRCGIASYGKIRIHRILRAFPRNFEEIIKNYGLKILLAFFVKKGLKNFRIFCLWNKETSNNTRGKHASFVRFLLFTISFHQVFLSTTDSRLGLGSSVTNTSILTGWKLLFLSQSF